MQQDVIFEKLQVYAFMCIEIYGENFTKIERHGKISGHFCFIIYTFLNYFNLFTFKNIALKIPTKKISVIHIGKKQQQQQKTREKKEREINRYDYKNVSTGLSVDYTCNPSFRRLKQEDCEFKFSLGYIKRHILDPLSQKISYSILNYFNLCSYFTLSDLSILTVSFVLFLLKDIMPHQVFFYSILP
jgi:hypothetical protein